MPLLTDQERLGTTLAEKYRLDRIVGRGGMGVVFAATHLWTGRPVAVKLLLPGFADDAGLVKRFLREARAAAGLQHPNVVDVLDMGSEPDGTVYLVLEMLVGESLDAVIERQVRLSLAEVAAWVVPVCDAVGAAHAQGIVHRDLKPDNVFLHRPSAGVIVPKLLDFGIAKVLGANTSKQTAVGSVIGTLHYMSPEQAEGRDDLGPASDVWALGVLLYECLTGVMPFDGSNGPSILLAISRGVFAPVQTHRPDLPPAIAALIARCLAPTPAGRFADARALGDALREALDGVEVASPTRIHTPMSFESPPPREIDVDTPTFAATVRDPRPMRTTLRLASALVGALVVVALVVSVRPVSIPSEAASAPSQPARDSLPRPAAIAPEEAAPAVPVAPAVAAPRAAIEEAAVDAGPPRSPVAPTEPTIVARTGSPRRTAPRAVAGHAAAPPAAPPAAPTSEPTHAATPAASSGLAREW